MSDDEKAADDRTLGGATTRTCSFCGKSQREVDRLIAGPRVHICTECIGLCQEILENDPITPILEIHGGNPRTRPAPMPAVCFSGVVYNPEPLILQLLEELSRRLSKVGTRFLLHAYRFGTGLPAERVLEVSVGYDDAKPTNE